MTTLHSFATALCLGAALGPALAADEHGHDHGAPTAPAGPALPRFAAVSDAFELVGVVDGRQLTVYLDRFADNSPVGGADIAMEIGGAPVALTAHEDGEYHGALTQELPPGTTAVTATVVADKQSDILAADLQLQPSVQPTNAAAGAWRRYTGWGAAVLVGLATFLWGLRRLLASRRNVARGAA